MARQNSSDRRIAVVGAGISGLGAAWLLHRSGISVTLFEKEAGCGGHSLTDESPGFPVDLGFQVFNLTTYPHLAGLLETLGVDTEESEMSFSLSMNQGALEWASHGPSALFAQRENLWKLGFWRMIWDALRFGREAPKALAEGSEAFRGMSLGQYLTKNGYSDTFRDHYLLPMCAAVWSAPNAQVLDFPVEMLVRFWVNHHLLDVFQRPVWRVVKNRSRVYVSKILAELQDIWINSEVTSVTPSTPLSRARVVLADGREHEFDAVILATHSDTSLKLLGASASKAVRDVLQAIPYNTSDVWVHTDRALMPRRREVWASWNFIGRAELGDGADVCVSYWLNRLQSLPPGAPDVFVTLNPVAKPAADTVTRHIRLAHPCFSREACGAQRQLPSVQDEGGIYLAGAWCGFGFHEDGLRAGVETAQLLGARIPWIPRATSPKISLGSRACMAVFDRFARLALTSGSLRLILPNGQELAYGSLEGTEAAQPGEEWRQRPPRQAVVRIYDAAFFWKIITRHDTGLGESYMDGDFEVLGDLGCLLAVLTANAVNIQQNRGALSLLNWVGDRLLLLAHLGRPNSILGSRQNIEQHYDAGNDMYRLFLDDTMTYSGAVYAPGDTLEQAQLRKLDSLISLADLGPDDNVLEIGCGWGSLAIRAVQTVGCTWTGITLSKEQLLEARKRVKAAGVEDRVTLLLCDYRDLAGAAAYDKVVSCEMVEAVGQENLGTYFRVIGAALKVGGTAVLQAISEPDDRYEAYCASSDFIREHIFPGGHLPCLGAMVEAGRHANLSITHVADIGLDYAVTLRAWRRAWEARRDEALRLGYSERFWRKYRFYFAYCEAAFDAKYIHNWQITWQRSAAVRQAEPLPVARDAEAGDDPMPTREPADPLTQVLLAVYFFLAGIAVCHSRRVWIVPLASVVYLLLLMATTAVVDQICRHRPRLKSELGPEGKAWLSIDAVHLLHSSLTAAAAAAHVAARPQAWLIGHAAQTEGRRLLPDLLTCTSAGFFGFQLFTLVHKRLFRRMHKVMLHFTVLLVVFGAAGYKAECTPLLACTLISEISTTLYLVRKILELCGASTRSLRMQRLLIFGELPATILLRLLPHAFVGASVLWHVTSFSNKGLSLAAVIGAVYINIVNVQRVAALLRAARSLKAHAD